MEKKSFTKKAKRRFLYFCLFFLLVLNDILPKSISFCWEIRHFFWKIFQLRVWKFYEFLITDHNFSKFLSLKNFFSKTSIDFIMIFCIHWNFRQNRCVLINSFIHFSLSVRWFIRKLISKVALPFCWFIHSTKFFLFQIFIHLPLNSLTQQKHSGELYQKLIL